MRSMKNLANLSPANVTQLGHNNRLRAEGMQSLQPASSGSSSRVPKRASGNRKSKAHKSRREKTW